MPVSLEGPRQSAERTRFRLSMLAEIMRDFIMGTGQVMPVSCWSDTGKFYFSAVLYIYTIWLTTGPRYIPGNHEIFML